MQSLLRSYDIKHWVSKFLNELIEIKKVQNAIRAKILDDKIKSQLLADYQKSSSRLILLDYDGTLVPFAKRPKDAKPDETLLELLKKLSDIPKNEVFIISGRDRKTLDKWFGDLNI